MAGCLERERESVTGLLEEKKKMKNKKKNGGWVKKNCKGEG